MSKTSSSMCTGVAGLITTAGSHPCVAIRCRVRFRCMQASWCTEIKLAQRIEGASSINVALPLLIIRGSGGRSDSISRSAPLSRPRNSAAAGAAFASQLEDAHDIERVLYGYQRGSSSKQHISHIRVVAAVVARRGWHALLKCDGPFRIQERQNAGICFLLRFTRHFIPRNSPGAQNGFLQIKSMLHVSAAGAMKNEARPRDWGKHCGAKKRMQSAGIMQGEIEGIVDNGLLALCA